MTGLRVATIVLLAGGLATSGCVTPAPRAETASPRVEVLGTAAPASRYGSDARQIFDNPALRDKIRAMFGRDWSTSNSGGLTAPAPSFFTNSSPPTLLRIDNAEWIAVQGCMADACAARHGLVLIGPNGDRLLARVDDRGFTQEYGYGLGMLSFGAQEHAVVDAAWRALALGTPRLPRS